MRCLGIDPGTVSVDLCGIDDGRVFLDQSLPTAQALGDPLTLMTAIESAGHVDLIAGPSGYGLPLIHAEALTERDVRLACLSAPGETGGIGGLASLLRLLGRSSRPVVFTPGVVQLPSVPAHRKVNRVDMGTADKVCAAMLAVHNQAQRRACEPRDVSFVLLELGGAFSAAVAVDAGRIVDGLGGSSGPIGMRAAGSLDGEVAFLAGAVTKGHLFGGGVTAVVESDSSARALAPGAARRRDSPRPHRRSEFRHHPAGGRGTRSQRPGGESEAVERLRDTAQGRLAWDAYIESAVKAVATLLVSVPRPHEIVLSGRIAQVPLLRNELSERLSALGAAPVRLLERIAAVSSHAAQGAALVADGLAGGRCSALVEQAGLREARGTVLDYLYVVDPGTARERLGIE